MKSKFTNDWFSQHIPAWEWALAELKGKPVVALELGSYEGQASCWLYDNILTHPDSKLICVDTWKGSEEHADIDMEAVYKRFLSNMKNKKRAEAHISTTTEYLLDNYDQSVDFIYIDASHRAADVLSDAVLSDMLLKSGGILIFDDYLWTGGIEHRVDTPRAAIDAFMECYADRYDVVITGIQVILRKK